MFILILVIMGGTCSGKTEFAKKCVEYGYDRVITNTTRQKRVDDSENSYHFLSREEFNKKIEANEMLEYAEYNGNLYGTSIDSITDKCVIVLEPNGFKSLKKIFGKKVLGIYLKTSDEERKKRGLLRGDNVKVLEERIKEDKEIFNEDFEKIVDMTLINAKKEDVGEFLKFFHLV